ncbi:MAG: hypothetical protein ACRD1V_00545 [Vicinamibacterales bacterium]
MEFEIHGEVLNVLKVPRVLTVLVLAVVLVLVLAVPKGLTVLGLLSVFSHTFPPETSSS